MVEEIRMWGYTGGPQGRLILKSDGEPAIMTLREAVKADAVAVLEVIGNRRKRSKRRSE